MSAANSRASANKLRVRRDSSAQVQHILELLGVADKLPYQ